MFTTPDLGRIAVVRNSSLSSSESRRTRGPGGSQAFPKWPGATPCRVSHDRREQECGRTPHRPCHQPALTSAPLHPRALLASGLAHRQHREWAVLPRRPRPSGVEKEDHRQQCRPSLEWKGEVTSGMPLWPESIQPSPRIFFFSSLHLNSLSGTVICPQSAVRSL